MGRLVLPDVKSPRNENKINNNNKKKKYNKRGKEKTNIKKVIVGRMKREKAKSYIFI